MKRSRLGGGVLVAVVSMVGLASAQPAEVDWEKAVAAYHQLDDTIKDNQRAKLTGDRLRQRQRWIVATYPGTDLAARSETTVGDLIAEKKYDAVVPALLAFIGKYPPYTEAHDASITATIRMLGSADVPEEIRVAGYEAMGPALKGRSLHIPRVANGLRRTSLSSTRRFEIIRKLSVACGPYPHSRVAYWEHLRLAAQELGADRYLKECRQFMEWAGKEGAPSRAARMEVLRAAKTDAAAVKELSAMEEESAAWAAAVDSAFASANKLISTGDMIGAAAALEKELAGVPAEAAEARWVGLLRNPALGEPSGVPVLDALVRLAPEGDAIDQVYAVIRPLRFDAAGMRTLVRLVSRHALDRERSCDIARFAIRSVATSEDPVLQLEAQRAAADVARRVDAPDRGVNFLLNLGKLGWDQSPDEVRAALREAAAQYPAILEAAEAGWMLAFLEGKLSVTQDALPRSRSVEEQLPLRPELALPNPPAATESVVTTAAGTELVKQDIKADQLKGQAPAASHGADTAALAVDGKADTAWAPDKLPASLIIPLAKESTIDRIRVAADSGLFFTASLLDRNGKTLTRVERDWAFWDYYRRTSYWPAADVTLGVLATPGVCYVRLDVYAAAEGDAVVQSVEAFGTPFAVAGQKLGEPVELAPETKSVLVHWEGDQPQKKVSYQPTGEWARGFYTVRWSRFWTRAPRLKLTSTGGRVGMAFYGDNASMTLAKPGAIKWQMNDEPLTYLDHPGEEPTEHPIPGKRENGFHILKVYNDRGPQPNDAMAQANTQLYKVDVDGVSRLRVAVRFGSKAGQWGPWMGPVESGTAIPVSGGTPQLVQAAAFFDGREVRGQESAVLKSLTVKPQAVAAVADVPQLDLSNKVPLKENLAEVAQLLQRRALVVAYPKVGTQAEYEAAQRLANKAQAYLVSDDIGLNLFSGTVLAVGTPHRHRYARQLLATHGLWNLPEYFADEDCIVGMDRTQGDDPLIVYATGETPEAVVRAADRLLAAIQPAPPAKTPVRLFASNTLENIYGWKTDSALPAPKDLSIRMAAGDRRSGQVGVVADKAVAKMTVTISDPVSASGARLSRPQVRPVGFYEWIPFFGDLRIPNALLPAATVTMPANTSRGVWVTAVTPADAAPGEYRADLTIDADGAKTMLPVVIRVEPVRLPPLTKTATYSFSDTPYWFHQGTAAHDAALRALARNEAMHGMTHVFARLQFKWDKEPYSTPDRVANSDVAAPPEPATWSAYTANTKTVAANGAILFAFPTPIQPREFFAAVSATKEIRVALSYWDGANWTALPARTVKAEKNVANALHWELGDRSIQFIRLTAEGGEGFGVDRIGAFTDKTRKYPAVLDFSSLDRQMRVFEEEYAKFGLTPTFIVQSNTFLTNLGADLFGVAHPYYAGVARMVGPQLNEMLERTGRSGRMLFKVADEPRDMKFWAEVAGDYHKAGLRTMTCHAILPDMDAAAGILNPWCPYYSHNVQSPFFRERQKAGDQFWWYTYGPPNMRLTGAPPENLIFYWLTGKWRIDGAMNYAGMHASDFSMPVPFRYDAGQDHRLLFLADGTLLDTPRRALEGEGISDLKLIEYVRDGAERLAKADPAAGKAVSDDLDKLLAETIPHKFGYSTDPDHWLKGRNALYDLAVRAAKK